MWEYGMSILKGSKNYQKYIYDKDAKKIIAIVDNLDEGFVENLIDAHNEALDIRYKDGLKDGIRLIQNRCMLEQYKERRDR